MKFEVDLNKLIDSSITIQNYLFLQIVYRQDYKALKDYKVISEFYNKDDILFLMSLGLIEFIDEEKGFFLNNIRVTKYFISKFSVEGAGIRPAGEVLNRTKVDTEKWKQDWYDLFPRGIKNGAYPIKGDRKGCFNKLDKFIKDYPEYPIDVIMDATEEYIKQSKQNNYKYMQQAHYFISKNNISTLASYCEVILDKREGRGLDDKKVDFIDDI